MGLGPLTLAPHPLLPYAAGSMAGQGFSLTPSLLSSFLQRCGGAAAPRKQAGLPTQPSLQQLCT